MSFGVWFVVTLAATGSVYELWVSRGYPMKFGTVFLSELCQILTYAPLTPLAFSMALRFPIQRANWVRRSLLHLSFAVVFSMAHVALRGLTPYAAWDAQLGHYVSAVWNSESHSIHIQWSIFRNLFFSNLVDDITGTYVPIVLVAHAVSYYRSLRDRELHSAKLEMQLTKSHLQALKSNLQPHFLFNTMHSISALMLTDVGAADKMMARLSDLLRMSLQNSETQMTCLRRELEFAAAYLEIEKIRFEDRLTVVVDVAPETLDAQVPSLLLQPLVENAIRHGIARVSSGGTVWITATKDGDTLHLRVKDNGPGLAKMDGLQPRTGVGLGTTRERLDTLYGDAQSLEIATAAAGGLEVCVKLPFQVESHSIADEISFAEIGSRDESGVA